jgi:hypothetical protein
VIRLLAPWALAAVVLLAGPVLVHMLLRRNARHVVFPATHFLLATRAAAVRLRRPSDIGLMILRLAIVAAAVIAVAQPIVVTPRRVAQWNARTVRAVILDTGRGMPDGGEAARLAQQEMAAFQAQQFAGSSPRDALARAVTWLAGTPPGRREVVIISDFQQGALDAVDLAVLPAGVGVRLVRAGTHPAARDVSLPAVAGFRAATWQPSARVEREATGATWTRSGEAPSVPWLTTTQPAGEAEAAARAVAAAASAGIASGAPAREVRIRFAGAPAETAKMRPVRERWMAQAVVALRRSPLLGETNVSVTTGELDGRLVVETTAAAASAEAPAVARAVILAVRPESIADREAEVATVSDAELATWRRDAAPVTTAPGEPFAGGVPDSDARWFWIVALLLLGVETWIRRAGVHARAREVRDAA